MALEQKPTSQTAGAHHWVQHHWPLAPRRPATIGVAAVPRRLLRPVIRLISRTHHVLAFMCFVHDNNTHLARKEEWQHSYYFTRFGPARAAMLLGQSQGELP